MNWKPAKVGAEPKKLAVLAGLLLTAGYFLVSNQNPSGPSDSAATPRAPVSAPQARPVNLEAPGRASSRIVSRGANSSPREFKPTFKARPIDPSKVDPTLHLALLAKLKNVPVEAGTRSLFDVTAPPPPPPDKLNIKEPGKIQVAKVPVGPMPPSKEEPAKPATPPDPKAPPIPLKFYGFVNPPKSGPKRAFFLDGDDIIIANEGDVIKKRYKIVRIGVNSAVVEDTQFKSNNQQTLPLEAEVAG